MTTELGARGLDAPILSHAISLDLPTDASHYAHRAGRVTHSHTSKGGGAHARNLAHPHAPACTVSLGERGHRQGHSCAAS